MDDKNCKDIGALTGYVNDEETYVSVQVHRVIPRKVKIGRWKKLTCKNGRIFWAKSIETVDTAGKIAVISFYSDIDPRGV